MTSGTCSEVCYSYAEDRIVLPHQTINQPLSLWLFNESLCSALPHFRVREPRSLIRVTYLAIYPFSYTLIFLPVSLDLGSRTCVLGIIRAIGSRNCLGRRWALMRARESSMIRTSMHDNYFPPVNLRVRLSALTKPLCSSPYLLRMRALVFIDEFATRHSSFSFSEGSLERVQTGCCRNLITRVIRRDRCGAVISR